MLLWKCISSKQSNNKLDYQWIGPFRVIEMVGPNAVRLDIEREYPLLRPVFNVSLLTK